MFELPQDAPAPVLKPVTAKKLAYHSDIEKKKSTSYTYRNQRGFPFQRAGRLVQAVPQFKTLILYSPVNTNSPTGQFQKTATPKAIGYPTRTV